MRLEAGVFHPTDPPARAILTHPATVRSGGAERDPSYLIRQVADATQGVGSFARKSLARARFVPTI